METFDLFESEASSESTSSAAASPARTSATQASARASMASAPAYGQSTPELLASYDPDSSSWRTSQLCLDGELSEFSETWPRSGLMRNGIAYRLAPLAPLTAGTESGSWPTPSAFDKDMGSPESILTRREREKAKGRNGNGFGLNLSQRIAVEQYAARMWPTPNLQDQIGGSLNPTWVEWLMGFPLGWTVCDALATPSSRKSRKSSDAQS